MGLFPVERTLGVHQEPSRIGEEMVQSGFPGKERTQYLPGMGKDRDEETGKRNPDPGVPDPV